MTMKLSEFNQLKKLMMLTHSDSDHEALSALRKANQKLKDHGYDWNAVFGRLVKVQEDIEAAPPEMSKNDEAIAINEAFEYLTERRKMNSFLTSLHEQWHDQSWLSKAQQEALFKYRRNK